MNSGADVRHWSYGDHRTSTPFNINTSIYGVIYLLVKNVLKTLQCVHIIFVII